MYALCGSLLKVALKWYENLMKQKEAEKQLVAGELALLRSQINPRFLLNTLTYVKSLIETRPEKAVYSIENLSEIMSYMLYETSAEKVPLDKEINYVNNYLNLQGVRYRPEFIRFEVMGSSAGILVPPLVFMPFLENAFLYVDESGGTPGIAIRLDIKVGELAFEVMNYRKEKPVLVESEEGFSEDTIKRCLDLLFGNNYSLDMKNDGSKYLVELNIKLAG
jgi:LytS/YehU family sensor histidine kinase